MTHKYECRRCGKVLEINVKTTNGAVRKQHACEDCNDITTFEKIDADFSDMTDAQREFLRKLNPKVAVSDSSNTKKHFHIINDGESICEHDINERIVEIVKYPLGYCDWCSHCLSKSKHPTEDFDGVTEEESVKKALQYADEKTDGTLTLSRYDNMDVTPSSWTVKQVFGSWAQAKEDCL